MISAEHVVMQRGRNTRERKRSDYAHALTNLKSVRLMLSIAPSRNLSARHYVCTSRVTAGNFILMYQPAKPKRTNSDPSRSGEDTDQVCKRSKSGCLTSILRRHNPPTQFRVNCNVLARHSSVFQDMLSLPQPPKETTIKGCPIVHLSDVPLELLLEALHDPYHNKLSQPFGVVAYMLRLGRKYHFSTFWDDAVTRIHATFPQNWMLGIDVGRDPSTTLYGIRVLLRIPST
ncbi:hypothetical protein B0H10DRAFT_1044883 [Mycena sp. CBHHK59/15]|nr:hypothetical protein B0H10DRAFT_1044883 [Mycena sp. CBHHK59/15]